MKKYYYVFCITFIFILFIILSGFSLAADLDINYRIGHNNHYISGSFIPVQIELKNTGLNNFSGELIVNRKYRDIFGDSGTDRTQQHVFSLEIPAGGKVQNRFSLEIFQDYFSPLEIIVKTENEVVLKREIELEEYTGDRVLIISDLAADSIDSQVTDKAVYTSGENLPAVWTGYQGFSTVIIKNVLLSDLDFQKREALARWLIQGNLLFLGGSSYYRNFNTDYINRNFPAVIQLNENITADDRTLFTISEQFNLFYVPESIVGDEINSFSEINLFFRENTGLFDFLTQHIFLTTEYWFPDNIMFFGFIFLMVLSVSFIYYMYNYYKWKIMHYFIYFFIIIFVLSLIYYTGLGEPLIVRNQKLRETAVIENYSPASTTGVEGYVVLLGREENKPRFRMSAIDGSFSSLVPYLQHQFTEQYKIEYQGEDVFYTFENESDWLPGVFRTHYITDIPVYVEGTINKGDLQLEIENNSHLEITANYIHLEGDWYQFTAREGQTTVSQEDRSVLFSRLPDSQLDLRIRILNRIINNKINPDILYTGEYTILVTILEGSRPAGAPRPEGEWQESFTGYFITPIKIE